MALLMSCAQSPHYVVTLRDGRQVHARSWPSFNQTTGYYRCEQEDGTLIVFQESQVVSIEDAGKTGSG